MIEALELTKNYGDVRAVDQVSFTIPQGEVFGLLGQIRRQMWDMIRKTKIQGRTVILTTHYIEEAENLCDRVGILSRGKLIAMDTPANLKASVGEFIVEQINREGKLIQQICKSPDEARELAKDKEEGVTIRKSNLEDVFIKLTGERIE